MTREDITETGIDTFALPVIKLTIPGARVKYNVIAWCITSGYITLRATAANYQINICNKVTNLMFFENLICKGGNNMR